MTTTPEERAEKIYQGWCEIDIASEKIHKRFIEDVAAQIREAEFEATQKAMDDDRIHLAVKTIARHQALEEAAKIADEHNGCIERVCLDRGLNCGITIAEAIRALAAAPKEGEKGWQ